MSVIFQDNPVLKREDSHQLQEKIDRVSGGIDGDVEK